MRSITVLAALAPLTFVGACAPSGSAPPAPAQIRVDTVRVASQADAELEERVALAQLRLLEKDVQLEELQAQLDETRQEVVRNMAKLQSQASRAEAASGIAEAEIALEALRGAVGGRDLTEFAQTESLLEQSSTEFEGENYGGALYLASEARAQARNGQARLRSGVGQTMRAGEALFVVPVPLQTSGRSNVREGPGLNFGVLFTLEEDMGVVGQSYTSQWVRVVDGQGRGGWIFHTLVQGPEG
jgi:hypothetical protein